MTAFFSSFIICKTSNGIPEELRRAEAGLKIIGIFFKIYLESIEKIYILVKKKDGLLNDFRSLDKLVHFKRGKVEQRDRKRQLFL